MNEACQALKTVLAEEIEFLLHVRNFLLLLPQLIATQRVRELDFFHMLETNEVRGRELLLRKQRALAAVAALLGVEPERVSFQLLANLGHEEFAELGAHLGHMAGEVSYAMLQASIYLKNFAHLNRAFQRLLDVFQPQAYSRGGRREAVAPGPRLLQEA